MELQKLYTRDESSSSLSSDDSFPPAFERPRHRKRKRPPPLEELFHKLARYDTTPTSLEEHQSSTAEGDNDPKPGPSSRSDDDGISVPSAPVERVVIDNDDEDDDDQEDDNAGIFVLLKDCYVRSKRL